MPPSVAMSEREVSCLTFVSQGLSNGEIGRQLHLSEDTIKTHLRRVFRKLGARDRAHAVALGFRAGVLTFRDLPEDNTLAPPGAPAPEGSNGSAALSAMMRRVNDVGPVEAATDHGMFWTAEFVYSMDSRRRVSVLPRHPPAHHRF